LAEFVYRAIDRQGNSVEGTIAAADQRAAISELTEQGLFATMVQEKALAKTAKAVSGTVQSKPILKARESAGFSQFGSKRITSKDILAFTVQLSTALNVGLPLVNALKIICEQQDKASMRELLEELVREVSSGKSFSEALAEHERVFSRLYVAMVRVGETGGMLDKTVKELAGLLGREQKIKTGIRNALAYPAFVLFVGIIAVVVMLTVVLPKIFETLGADVSLPMLTQMLLGMGAFFGRYGVILGVILGVVVWRFLKWKNSPRGRFVWDSFLLRVPVLGKVILKIAVGRFTRTLGILTGCGITILTALEAVKETLDNELLCREIDKAASKVKVGQSLADSLSESGRFPPLLVQIVAIGENTGKLDEILLSAAETFEADADAAITRFMTLFPAVIILILAVVIFLIIAATLLPIVAMELTNVGV